MMRSRSHDEAMAEVYRSDPAFALELMNTILKDGDQADLLVMLRQLAQAFGGLQAVAAQAHLNPTQLYRTLSPKGNPSLSSLAAILKAMGLRLAVQPLAPLHAWQHLSAGNRRRRDTARRRAPRLHCTRSFPSAMIFAHLACSPVWNAVNSAGVFGV